MTKLKVPVKSHVVENAVKKSCLNHTGKIYEKQKRGEYLKRRAQKKKKNPRRSNCKRQRLNILPIDSSNYHHLNIQNVKKNVPKDQTLEKLNPPAEHDDKNSNLNNLLSNLVQSDGVKSTLRLQDVKTCNHMAVITLPHMKTLQNYSKSVSSDHLKVLKTNFFTLTFPDKTIIEIELSLYLNGFGASEGRNVSVSIRGKPEPADPCQKPGVKVQDLPQYVVSVFLQHPKNVSSNHRKSFKFSIRDINCKTKGLLDFISLEKFEDYIDSTGGVKLGLMVQK